MTFQQLEALFAATPEQIPCMEVHFSLPGSETFHDCWMGRLYDQDARRLEFWYGLTPDGQNAYDYGSFEELAGAKVFDGKDLRTVWAGAMVHSVLG